uniref:Uncharacterized protein n=1 Tax=Kalanchoe fedtschenkoi TaxID=63787 RepID=A0A7N0TX56_KALFE
MDLEGDVMMEGAVSSAILSSLEFNEGDVALSSEDLAWVDSCLVPDPDVPEGSWDSLRDALLDVLASQPSKSSDSVVPRAKPVQLAVEESDGGVEKDLEEKKDDEISDLMKELRFENALLPTYKEGAKVNAIVEEEDDLGFVLDENETGPLVDEIFKVWELESPWEDGDFVTQLNKALKSIESTALNSAEASYETMPLSAGDVATTASWKNLEDEFLDSIIAGIADLSLGQFHG